MEPIPQAEETVVDVPAAEFWPFVRNTDRINRALRLPSVTYDPPLEGSLTRVARARVLPGVEMSWDEPPFEWVERQYYLVRRRFHSGPISDFTVGVQLVEEAGKTRVRSFIDALPTGPLSRWVALALARHSLRSMSELTRSIAAALRNRALHPYARPKQVRELRPERLRERLASLAPAVDAALRSRLGRHLSEAYDEEVVRMRPFALADEWSLPRLEVLRAFLHAGKAGLLDVSWEVLCPNCRVSKAEYGHLSALKAEAHCETCGITFGADFDVNVEVRFTVNASIRRASGAVYCLGGPANTPHRSAQVRLEANAQRTTGLELGNRRYTLRSLKGRRRMTLIPQAGSGARSVEAAFAGGEPASDSAAFAPGAVELRLANAGAGELWVALDEEAWSGQGATAALVTTLQEFRDLFASEVLSPDQTLSVRHLAVVFTDLKDSTAMYERIGDARAYALVRAHFKILTDSVRAHGGSVVKTIGDAVMAVFSGAEDALAASLDIQRMIAAHNAGAPEDGKVQVKLGLHAGPSIAVNSNDSLDYFGTTVNIAARIQSQSQGGDIVLSEAVASSAGCRELLEKDRGKIEEFSVNLKGLSEHFRLRRLWPAFGRQ